MSFTVAGSNKPSKGSDVVGLVIKYIILVAVIGITVLYIYGQFIHKNPRVFNFYCESYTGTWTLEMPDGETETFVAPTTIDIYDGVPITFSTVLPDDLKDDTVMFIRTGRSFIAYVDGIAVKNFDADNTGLPGISVKSIWIPIYLSSEYSGKTLTIERYSTRGYNGNINDIYLANSLGFLVQILNDNLFILVLAFFLLILSLLIALFCIVYRLIKKTRLIPVYLSLGIFFASIWLIVDNYCYSFLFRNYFIDGIIEYLIVMLLPFPFSVYLNLTQKRRYQSLFNGLNIILILSFGIFTTLDFSGISNFNNTSLPMNIVLGLYIAALVVISFYDIFYRRNRDYIFTAIGFGGMIVMSAAELVHVNLDYHTNDGIFFAFGLLLLFIFAAIHEITKVTVLQRESIEANQSNKAKSSFLANMSHEIRTPINAIMGFNSLVLREQISGRVKEYSDNIRSASQTLLDIVNDILDFSRIEQGRMELLEENYELGELLNNVCSMCRVKADEKKLNFKTEIGINLPSKLCGDQKHIREILINLLNNAVKYTSNGSVLLHVYSQVAADKSFNLCFKVRDTGIGIRDEDREKVFKNFERLDINKNRNVEGSGLGLSITKGLVELMNGQIDFESVYGRGTTFTVVIPQKIVDAKPIGDLSLYARERHEKKEENTLKFTAPMGNVLIVDDNILNLKVVAGLLARTMVDVTTCQSGDEMLNLITRKKYDIILLDHMMPGMDGIEAHEHALKLQGNKNAGTPYIALTANAINGAKEMYLQHGFTDYLSKPIEGEALEDMLIKYLPMSKIRTGVGMNPRKKDSENSTVGDIMPESHVNVQAESEIVQNNQGEGDLDENYVNMTGQIEVNRRDAAGETEVNRRNAAGETEINTENATGETTLINRNAVTPDIDVALGIHYCGDMEDFYHDTLELFVKLTEDRVTNLNSNLESGDFKNYQITIHAIKSNALTIGAKELSEKAKALEFACKEDRTEYVLENHDEVMELFIRVTEEAKELIGS